MNDRLRELRGDTTPYTMMDDDVESRASSRSESRQNIRLLEPFFGDVEVVKANIHRIEEITRRIFVLADGIKMTSTKTDSQAISEELSYIVGDGNAHAKASKELLEKMRSPTTQTTLPDAQQKIRTNVMNTLTRKFVEVIKAYQAAQQHYKKEVNVKVTRQIRIVKPDVTDEEVQFVLTGGDPSDVIQAAILQGHEAADPIKAAYATATDKYQDVLLLESSVRDLNEMFVHFALLTERQGDLLDNIEAQVGATTELVEAGNVNLTEAIELSKAVRKKQCILIVIILVIIGVILAIVFGSKDKK